LETLYSLIPYCAKNGLTVCVTGAGAGVDSAWEQEKLEARKILEKPYRTPASSARFVGRGLMATIPLPIII